MKNRIILSLAFIFTIAFFSCKKDEQQTSTVTEHVNSMSAFNAAHKKPTQHFTLNASSGGPISTTGGIDFSFPANAFVNSSGNIITGNVEIQIDEVISKADLIYNSISTHSDGRPLNSGGAYRIQATQGSEILSMAPGKEYHVWLTSNSNEPTMLTYYGLNTSDQYGKINWTTTPPGFSSNVFTYTTDSVNIYEMIVAEFNWINCDFPYDTSFAGLNITLPSGAESAQIMVFDNASMFGINLWASNNSAYWNYAPLNKALSVLVLKQNAGVYQVSAQTFTFTGQTITMPMFTTISESDLTTLINLL